MEKKFLIKDIIAKNSKTGFTWGKIKEYAHLFEDNDIVAVYYDKEDSTYILNVTREVLETDEEFEERMILNSILEKEMKKRRYERYLELKKEFDLS